MKCDNINQLLLKVVSAVSETKIIYYAMAKHGSKKKTYKCFTKSVIILTLNHVTFCNEV
jgi:hypothetical protein